MINQQLLQYIQQNVNSGYDANAIRTTLVSQGYKQQDIDETINYVQSQKQGAVMPKNNAQYAGFWIRFSALVWDSIILGIPVAIIQFALMFITRMQSMMYLVSVGVIAFVVYMNGTKGGTPGKLILGLRIQNQKGDFIGIPIAILRYIGRIISALILGIGYLMIAWDPKKQGLHDKIAKTFVVKTKETKGLYIVGLVLGILGMLFILALPFLFLFGAFAYFGKLNALVP